MSAFKDKQKKRRKEGSSRTEKRGIILLVDEKEGVKRYYALVPPGAETLTNLFDIELQQVEVAYNYAEDTLTTTATFANLWNHLLERGCVDCPPLPPLIASDRL